MQNVKDKYNTENSSGKMELRTQQSNIFKVLNEKKSVFNLEFYNQQKYIKKFKENEEFYIQK